MTEEKIITTLKILRRITPDTDYVRNSRFAILTLKRALTIDSVPRPNILAQSLNFAASVTLVAATLLIIVLGGAFGLFKTLFLPPLQGVDVNNQNLATEADTISQDIDIRLREITYLKEGGAAVAYRPGGEQISAAEEATDREIDKLLDQVINY